MSNAALIIVDVQNDFCPGGSLAVPNGDSVIPALNFYATEFERRGAIIFASRDWHPTVTTHFRDYGGAWPVHCVQGTRGAEFHPNLRLPRSTHIVDKGTGSDDDAYSAFEAMTANRLLLETILRQKMIKHVYVGGLATDYCVKATVVDALRRGFQVTLLLDAARGVDVQPHDSEKALEEMVWHGARVTTREQVGSCEF